MKTTALEEFRKISAVPRRSYHNEKIIAYCLERGKELGFETWFDEKKQNVLIRRDAAPGKEDHPGIVLQGHLDMVAQTDEGIVHDWENDGLELIQEGDLLTAKGTTLGADNGVAAAIAFALLADEELKNPPLEVLLTTNEEVGMDSVKDADLSYLQGDFLFNLDGGGEGEFVTGCCGGRLLKVWIPEEKEEAQGHFFRITVSGLKGGHSGIEIGTERANAIRVLGQALSAVGRDCDFRLADIRAEGKDNAISKAAWADIVVPEEMKKEKLASLLSEFEKAQRKIFRLSDPDISVSLTEKETPEGGVSALTKERTRALAFLLREVPYGVLHHEQSLDGNVETSANPGLIEKGEKGIGIVISVRSSVEERCLEVAEEIEGLAEISGAYFEEAEKAYPAWLPDTESPLIPLFGDMYRKMYGKEPKIGPVHAGLECGYILKGSSLKAAISTGPVIHNEHTTAESLSVSSLQRTFEFIRALIEEV